MPKTQTNYFNHDGTDYYSSGLQLLVSVPTMITTVCLILFLLVPLTSIHAIKTDVDVSKLSYKYTVPTNDTNDVPTNSILWNGGYAKLWHWWTKEQNLL